MNQGKKEKIGLLMKQLSMIDEEQREIIAGELGITNPDGHILSVRNQCLLVFQAGDNPLSVVAGFKQWQKSGRIVSKGSRGYLIAVPSKNKAKEDKKEDDEENETFFLYKTVFDISQTEELILEEV